uniref:LRAT domain-containing protein n=1 Tax=Ficedula albicollis TaxID=59894 RepID=A0A803VM16_FICAL
MSSVPFLDEGVPPLSADSDTILNIKVTKELLKEVIESDAWAVNNKYDQYCTPLPVEEIIQCAEGSIGKEMAYDVFDFKADDFVTKLRYGVQHRAFFGGESHILDMRDDEEYPKPGDLIEIKRGHYDHWALYVGDGYVIHVAPVDDGVACLSAGSGTILIIKVTKELLKEVAGKDAWAVNNKYDQYCTPLPVDEIIWRAEGCIGEEMAYDVFDFKADEFVTKLRYGGQLRAFVGGESHILDTGDDKEYPIPGDLIEIDRPLYQHWALYVGNGNVIHVTPVGENSPPASGSTMTLLVKRAKVKKELLEDAAGGDNWRVNNKYDEYREPFPVEEILRRAESQIGKVVLYRLFYKNCEHFVTEVRYGEGVSEQRVDFVSGEMGILDMRDDEEYPKPGDLIEIKQGHDQHWALYVGRRYVIHVTPVDEGAPSLSGSSDTRRMRKAKVKKELLREVARNKKWRISNEYDFHCPPLPVEEIIRHAEGCVGTELTYDELKFKSVHFLSKLRHVGLWRDFVSGEMDILDMRDDEEYPKPGDLIEIKQGHDQHWALYVGGGYVIHVTPVDEGAPSLSGSSDTRRMRKAKVKKELLREVARNKKWRVNNECDCHRPPLPVEEIIWHAEGCVGKKMTYDELKFKSVHFLSKLRHVGLFRAFEGGKIHRHDSINRKYLPIPGDLIEIKRPFYQHWAIYVGGGYVIHVTPIGKGDVSG